MAIETLYTQEMAEWYDHMYCDEETTKQQLKFLTNIFRKHHVKSVLDVACGTGRHAIELQKRGFNVVGVDLEVGMIDYAQKQAKTQKVQVEFKVQDMREIKVKGTFDAAIVFFTAFAYLKSNDDVIQTLQSIHSHLKKDGLLIIETFFGWPKIISGKFKMKMREKIVKKGNKSYQVIDENFLDSTNNYMYTTATHIRKVGSKKLKILKDKKPTQLRLYFPNELDLFFRLTGFQGADFYGDLDGHKLSKEYNQRLVVVVRKK